MERPTTSIVNIIQLCLGLAFIVSGLSKALSAGTFGELLSSYGISELYWLSPVIIFVELLLGMSLFLGISTKAAAAATAVVLVVFTSVYTYGYIVFGIKRCGCYGGIDFLESSPTVLYIRNGIMLCGAIWLYLRSTWDFRPVNISVFYSAVVFSFVCAVICGFTFSRGSLPHRADKVDRFEPIALSEHPLRGFIDTSADSTYLVTVFSYSCPHCINTMGNIEQFQRLHYVDKVIGLGVESSGEESPFQKVFSPTFPVSNYIQDEILKLTDEFPVSYFISNDSITKIIKGELPSVYFFMMENSVKK